MSHILTKGTNSYKEAVQATENIEAPSIGFAKQGDYQSTSVQNSVIIKQNNTQLHLQTQILETLRDIQSDIKTLLEEQRKIKGINSPLPEALITKLSNLTLGPHEKPKEPQGRLLVFRDPLKILKEEQLKLK